MNDLLGTLLPVARRRPGRRVRRVRLADPQQLALDFAVLGSASAQRTAAPSDVRGRTPTAPEDASRGGAEAASLQIARHVAPSCARARRAAAAQLYARLGALGLTGVTHLALTRNRTVMVSRRGTQLRVHGGFADAPDDTLGAIVRFVTARRRNERAEAVRALRAFPLPDVAPRRPRLLVTAPDDRAMAARLSEMHRALNARCFGGALQPIEVVVSRRMKTRLGHYALAKAGTPGQIALSRRHLTRHGWTQGAETLLHEMVHQWQDETGLPVDHGPAFRRKAMELGITPAAKRTV